MYHQMSLEVAYCGSELEFFDSFVFLACRTGNLNNYFVKFDVMIVELSESRLYLRAQLLLLELGLRTSTNNKR